MSRTCDTISPKQLALVTGLLLLCFALFVSDLGWRDLWYDEVGDFMIAAQPVPDIWAANRAESLDPPLYYYLLHYWSILGGRSEVALRFPSVLLAVLAVAVTFVCARRWLGFGGGWATALLLAGMPPVIYYAQEVNQYAGLVFFTSLALWTFDHASLTDRPGWLAWGAFTGVAAAGLLWHYGFVWCWLSLNLVFLIRRMGRAAWLSWGIAQGIVGLVGIVLFVTMLKAQYSVGSAAVYLKDAYPPLDSPFHYLRFLGIAWLQIPFFFLGGHYAPLRETTFVSMGLSIGGLVAGGLARLRSKDRECRPVVYLGATSLVLMGANLLRLYPLYGGRHLMMLAPLLAVAWGWAWQALPRPLAQLGVLLTAGLLALAWPHRWAAGYSHGENTRALLFQFEANSRPCDSLFVYAESVRTYQYYQPQPRPFTRYGRWWAYDNLDGVLAEMDTTVLAASRTWLAFTRCLNIDGVCQALFEAIPDRYYELYRWEDGQSRLFLVQPRSEGNVLIHEPTDEYFRRGR